MPFKSPSQETVSEGECEVLSFILEDRVSSALKSYFLTKFIKVKKMSDRRRKQSWLKGGGGDEHITKDRSIEMLYLKNRMHIRLPASWLSLWVCDYWVSSKLTLQGFLG